MSFCRRPGTDVLPERVLLESSRDPELSDPELLAAAKRTASAHESNRDGQAGPAVDEDAAATSTHTEARSAPASVPPVNDNAESEIKEATAGKEVAEPDDEHMVEGDEDTVIY